MSQQQSTRPAWARIAVWAGALVLVVAGTFGLYVAVGGLDEPERPAPATVAGDVEEDVKAACRSALLGRLDDGFEWYSETVQRGVGSAAGWRVTGTGSETVAGQRVGGERSWTCLAEAVPGEGIAVLDVGFEAP